MYWVEIEVYDHDNKRSWYYLFKNQFQNYNFDSAENMKRIVQKYFPNCEVLYGVQKIRNLK